MKNKYTIIALVFAALNFAAAQTSHKVLVGPNGQFSFQPKNLSINSGDTVVWKWKSNNHSTTSDNTTGPETWDSGILNAGAVYSRVFTTAGTYNYHCIPHRSLGMVGSITVKQTTGVKSSEGNIDLNFKLKQNYPNPFNPATTIEYTIPLLKNQKNSGIRVKLKIFDLLGREVRTILNVKQTPGIHIVKFNAGALKSGIYFYKLTAGNFVSTKKMILLK